MDFVRNTSIEMNLWSEVHFYQSNFLQNPYFNTYYETEIPSLTRISLHVVLTNLVNMNFAYQDFFPEPKVALTKELVYE